MAAQENETVRLLKNVTGVMAEPMVLILNNRTLDLNGRKLEATNVIATAVGANIKDSSNGKGLLKVAKNNLTLMTNEQLPIWCEDEGGFRFVNVETDVYEEKKDASQLILQYWFLGALDGDMKQHLAKVDENELKVYLRVDYTYADGSNATLNIVIPDDVVVDYANTAVEPYFRTTISGLNGLGNATITTCVSSRNVEISGASYTYTAITE